MFALVLQIPNENRTGFSIVHLYKRPRTENTACAKRVRPFAKIRTGESKSKLACILPGGRIFDEVKGTNNSGKAAETGPPEAFFQPNVIFSARKCAKIKNMSIFAVPNERFFVREIGEMPEWSIGPHSKCGVRATVPGVRIPLSPQITLIIKALQIRRPKRNPFFGTFRVFYFCLPLKSLRHGDFPRRVPFVPHTAVGTK